MMRTTVMEGDFGEFDLASVIQVVSIGRQFTGVELFDDGGRVVGTLFLKSGKIVSANTGSTSGIDAVASLLRGGRHKRFSVYRTEPFSDVMSPVGSVAEILFRLTESEPPEVDRIPVMEGNLVEFDLLSVLQVISIGRQFTAVEVSDGRGSPVGVINLKSGKVLSATSGHLTGVDAIRRLARCPRESRFVVYRSRGATAEHHLGPLGQILIKLADPDDQWDVEQNTRTKAAPVDMSAARKSSMAPRPSPGTNAAPVASPVSGGAPLPPAFPPPLPAAAAAPAVRPPVPPPPPTAPQIDVRSEHSEGRAISFIEAGTNPGGMQTLGATSKEVPVLAVTSPKGGAGKTTVSINLGVALARQGKRVVLVDADSNGVLLALNGAAKAGVGVYDVAAGRSRFSHVAIQTRVAGFRIVPSGDPMDAPPLPKERWSEIFAEARVNADVVLVDTAAGLHGAPGEACAAATHSLVVLPAEPAAARALPWHMQRLGALGHAPSKVLGIVLNLLDYRTRVSLDVLRDLCSGPSAPWVFDIPIARSPAFMEAVARGVPVCRGDRADTPTIGWVFEMLASGVSERLGMLTPHFDEALLD